MGEFDTPFLGSAAIANGRLTRHDLRCDYQRIFRDVYLRKGIELDLKLRSRAALLFGGANAVLVGLSAAAVHGTKWIADDAMPEIVREGFLGAPKGLIIRGDRLNDDEVDETLRATTPARTAFDLGRRLPPRRAVATIDALSNATGLKAIDVDAIAMRYPGARGIVKLRTVLPLIDGGAESPQETYTRLVLIEAGLPAPTTQLLIRDDYGDVIARADLGWQRWKVIVEYDGAQHWTDPRQRSHDIERTAALEAMGWRIVRVDADLLRRRPHILVARVRAALRAAGAPVN
ncbi:DUF559 domain-containing protein [Skermania sp. ID1734]|uniref:endonuclease domain-containing protein n=1 Tax=Skermania sp. ID1734 TaxID=2597516 RepID=UPI00117E255A|nr:DUF559 domain-containing protein [Skermania sp. ID1734]TSD98147.1 DUF559 domain-containing protein [Skermania sp. ID1734]